MTRSMTLFLGVGDRVWSKYSADQKLIYEEALRLFAFSSLLCTSC